MLHYHSFNNSVKGSYLISIPFYCIVQKGMCLIYKSYFFHAFKL